MIPAPPVAPMLARLGGHQIPSADQPGDRPPPEHGWAYEPKWDGFRALVFTADPESARPLIIQSRNGEDITYCFPELVETLARQLPPRSVLDGELVVLRDGRPDFPTLTSRIRPRSEAGGESIRGLASKAPAEFICFDALAVDGVNLMESAYDVRRGALEELASGWARPLHLSPATTSAEIARRWFDEIVGAGIDGVIVKDRGSTYQPGQRVAWKIKPEHTVDVVVAGWRPHRQASPTGGEMVGSLVLGLYDDDAVLHHIGVTSAFPVARRVELIGELAPYAIGEGEPHPWAGDARPGQRLPGGASRWSSGPKGIVLLRPELVAEIRCDGFTDGRLRHTARFVRWRPDKPAEDCTDAQIPAVGSTSLADVLAGEV